MLEPTKAKRKVRKARKTATHEDIRNDINVLFMATQRTAEKMDAGFAALNVEVSKVKKTVGETSTDSSGKLRGTGIAGDVARMKKKFDLLDGLVKFCMGFAVATSVFAPVIWWLIHNRISFLQ